MKTVSLREAEADLPRLIEAASRGEPFVIAENGRPLVRVVPAEAAPPRTRRIGFLAGQISVPDDFDTMFQDEIIRLFEGEEVRHGSFSIATDWSGRSPISAPP